MTAPHTTKNASAGSVGRFHAMDEARTLAIFAMILAHWGGSVIEQLHLGDGVIRAHQIVSRFATPAFVTVFALTAGIVYLHKYRSGDPERRHAVEHKLLGRARFVFWMGLLVAVPDLLGLLGSPIGAKDIALTIYGVLMSYSIVIALMPLVFRLSRGQNLALIGGGVLLWVVAGVVVFRLWMSDPDVGWTEWLRLYFFSGAYAVLPMLATMMMLTPVGALFHKLSRARFRAMLAGLGGLMLVGGLGAGMLLGHTEEILRGDPGLKAPPTAWFFAMYGGAAMLMIVALDLLPEKGPIGLVRRPVRLLGASALQVYVAHVFVQPAAALLEPALGRLVSFGLALAIFGVYLLWVMRRRAQRGRG